MADNYIFTHLTPILQTLTSVCMLYLCMCLSLYLYVCICVCVLYVFVFYVDFQQFLLFSSNKQGHGGCNRFMAQ